MSIHAFRITGIKNTPFKTRSSTLDEMTRELPQGFYTTFSTLMHGKKVLNLRAHLRRLYVPAMELGITPSVDEAILRKRIAELASLNLPHESRIRLILTKSLGAVYAGIQAFVPIPQSTYEKGVKVITANMARQSPRVKDTGFIFSSSEQRKQVRQDVFEILLVRKGKILEGMTSNFYAVKGNTLVTARSGILLGVTRRVILGLARGQGMSIEYQAPKVAELEDFDESFLTSSSRGVVPIISIDNKPVGQGSVSKWTWVLLNAYQAYVEEHSEKIVK